jgi:tetratricopeptide (TPR) repeat protein
MNFIKEERFKQAERLVKKYSRNKGNEIGKKLLSLGFLYGTAENYDLAIFCLELSEKISRDINIKGKAKKYLAIAHALLGSRLTEAGLFEEAEAHYKKAISIRPDFSHFHNNYAILLRKWLMFQ